MLGWGLLGLGFRVTGSGGGPPTTIQRAWKAAAIGPQAGERNESPRVDLKPSPTRGYGLVLNGYSLGGPTRSERMALKWKAARAERIGGRKEQQDRVGFFHSRDGKACLLLVADGMGGHCGGSLAAQTLFDIAEMNWGSCSGAPDDPKQFLEHLCERAHHEVNLHGRERGLEPRSTVVALIVREPQAFWVHIGDSRLYRFRGHQLLGRTKDHSLVQVLVDAGEVTEDQMATHPDQNRLLRSIGGENPPKTTHGHSFLQVQDRFLLCSDGFWERITVEELAVAVNATNMDWSLNHLADLAAKRGGPIGDNVAAAAVRLSGFGPRKR